MSHALSFDVNKKSISLIYLFLFQKNSMYYLHKQENYSRNNKKKNNNKNKHNKNKNIHK